MTEKPPQPWLKREGITKCKSCGVNIGGGWVNELAPDNCTADFCSDCAVWMDLAIERAKARRG